MRLTVLGKSPSWQDADGACSGYLLEDDGAMVLIDCGNGVFGKLRHFADYVDVDAVVLSHMHADHFLDLIPFSYALTYGPRGQENGEGAPARPRLVCPPGARDVLRRVVGAWGKEDLVESAFAIEGYEAGSTVEVGPLRISFHPVPHFIDAYGISVESATGASRLVYGGDSGPAEELVELARGADLLLVEATLPQPETNGDRGHQTPEEAGEQARDAGVKKVVITHISDELDQDDARRRASKAFGASVEVAREGAIYEI
jgi:ribonuclease BN (tRNA processing enzyme)